MAVRFALIAYDESQTIDHFIDYRSLQIRLDNTVLNDAKQIGVFDNNFQKEIAEAVKYELKTYIEYGFLDDFIVNVIDGELGNH